MTNKAAKGDVVAIEFRHSSTSVAFKTTVHYAYELAFVEAASRDGIVKRVRVCGHSRPMTLTHYTSTRTLTIGGPAQDNARRLAAIADQRNGGTLDPELSWTSADDLRAAVLAA